MGKLWEHELSKDAGFRKSLWVPSLVRKKIECSISRCIIFFHLYKISIEQVRLDETQMADANELRGRLQQELELLIAYQSKIKMHGEAQHQREREILEERVSIRRAVLEEQVSLCTRNYTYFCEDFYQFSVWIIRLFIS